jgi:ATP-dependent 26S proteasome regulatory subunit
LLALQRTGVRKSDEIADPLASIVQLDIQNIRPVEWDKKAFDRLVLDDKTKELIYALVDVQNSGRNKVHDVIKGKGNGLIILLHGSPGTGKTLTAER